MKRLKLVVLLAAAMCGAGCGGGLTAECGRYCSLSLERRHAEFRAQPLEKQLDIIHVCRHESACRGGDSDPADKEIIDLVAERGESAVPLLVERLREETDEERQSELIAIFRSMGLKGYLKGRRDVAALVSEKASQQRGGFITRLLEEESGGARREQWARDVSEEMHRHTGRW